jgi:hypothetical protein
MYRDGPTATQSTLATKCRGRYPTRIDVTRRDSTRLDTTLRDSTRLDATRLDATRRDATWRDATRCDETRLDVTRRDETGRDSTQLKQTGEQFCPILLHSNIPRSSLFTLCNFWLLRFLFVPAGRLSHNQSPLVPQNVPRKMWKPSLRIVAYYYWMLK